MASDLGLHCLPIILLGSPDLNGLRQADHVTRMRDDRLLKRVFIVYFVVYISGPGRSKRR